jgi:hypothetical protein
MNSCGDMRNRTQQADLERWVRSSLRNIPRFWNFLLERLKLQDSRAGEHSALANFQRGLDDLEWVSSRNLVPLRREDRARLSTSKTGWRAEIKGLFKESYPDFLLEKWAREHAQQYFRNIENFGPTKIVYPNGLPSKLYDDLLKRGVPEADIVDGL